MMVRIQTEDFDVGLEIERLRCFRQVGAVNAFVGQVREWSEGDDILGMVLEHYPGMTEKSLQAIVARACERWQIQDALVIHRVGNLRPLDKIVLVVTVSDHRQTAFASCEYIVDSLKTEAPFWKKEVLIQGERWVEHRSSDDEAVARW